MGAHWIIAAILCVSAWESAGITNKGRPLLQETLLRNFRHVPGPSASVSTDWEVGLREAVNQALLRERYHDYNLRERLLEAPLIGRQDVVTPFGDIVILARGQLYVTQGGNFLFVQDQYQNDCDACHNPRPRCGSTHCQTWRPEENEHLVALWTVKRLRHRSHNDGYYYELEYIVSPISPSIREFVIRNGHFDYGIPGHIFIVRNDKTHNQPEQTFVNRRLPHPHFKPEVIIGITTDGERHVLQSYPGFYTSFPVHPTYHHHHRYSTNDPREIELYKELIESLAAKTSSTQKTETGPHKFSLNGYTEATTIQVQSTKPSYDSFPTTQGSMMELSTRPLVGTTTIQFPQTTHRHATITKPPTTPTKPTELSTQEIFDTPKPITTIHYFTPIGEEDLITDGITEMQKITLGTVTKEPEETGSDFLFPKTETTLPSKTTTKKYYKPTTITVGTTEMKGIALGTVTKNQEETGSDFLFPKTETTLPSTTTKKYHRPTTTIVGTTEMKGITLGTFTKNQEETGSDFLFPKTETTLPSKTTTKKYYKPTTITEEVPNILEEPNSKTTKQYETTIMKTKPMLPTTTTKTITLKSTTKVTTTTTKRRPGTTKSRPSKPTTTKLKAPETSKTTMETPRTTKTSTTESPTPKITTSKVTATSSTTTTTKVTSTPTIPTTLKTATEVPSSTTMKTTTVKLRTTKTKLSNLTGFIASTTMGTKKITTYKPKFTTTKLTTKLTTPESTRLTTQEKETSRQRTTVATTFSRPTRPQRPMIYLDYTLLEDISPTEPMKITSLRPEETQSTSLLTVTSIANTTTPYTTDTTRQGSNEFTTDDTATTKREGTSQILFTSTINAIFTTEGISTATEPTQTTTVTQENGTDSATTSREETDTTTQGTTKTTLADRDEVSILFTTDTTRNERLTTITTLDTTSQLPESTTTSPTSRKPTISESKPSTTTNDFLTEDGNMEKPTYTKPDNADIDEYDIFGSTKPQTKPTKSPTVKVITESDLASALFGSREEKVLEEPDTTPFKGTRIIYSNFFEASTTPLPDTSEYATQTESYETTTNFKPLTSQSYATSISFKAKKKNDTSTESDSTTPSTTVDVDKPTESVVTTTKETKPDTRKTFDRLALQLVNHAKSIDYLNGGNNKTSRAKYKRRKTYVPKNRRLNRKQVT